MKLLQIFSLFVVCNAGPCAENTYCTGECTCGSNAQSNTCSDKNSFCKNPTANDASGIYPANAILAHGKAATSTIKYCIQKGDMVEKTANECAKDWVCNIKTGSCVDPTSLIPENLSFAFGKKTKCLTSTGEEHICEVNEYCDRTKTAKKETCLPFAEDQSFILKGGNQKKICRTVAEVEALPSSDDDHNKLVNYEKCELDSKCVNGKCFDLCQQSVICSPKKQCICETSSNIYDCNNSNLYCKEYNTNEKPTDITTIQYLGHGDLAVDNNSKYCADSEKLPTTWTIAKVCKENEYCNHGATKLNDLCRPNGARLGNYKKQSVGVEECYYKKNIESCLSDEFCYESATTPENACLDEKNLDAQLIINAVKEAVSEPAAAADEETKMIAEVIANEKTEEKNEKNGTNAKDDEEDTNDGTTKDKASDGVYGIAIGALIVGVINLILIGSVLVLLLCCNNKKGGSKKENV